MKIKKIWISSDSGKHTLHILGGLPGIALLMTVLIIGGMFLSFFFDLPRKIFSPNHWGPEVYDNPAFKMASKRGFQREIALPITHKSGFKAS